MRKAILAAAAIMAGTLLADTTPVMVSLVTPVQAPDGTWDVTGLRLSLIYGECNEFTGLDIGIANRSKGDFYVLGIGDGIVVKGADGAPVEHVWIGTSGEFIFWSLPIATGRFRWDEKTKRLETGTAWFRDFVSVADVQDALVKHADSRNCDLVDVSFHDADTSCAGASYEGLPGMFFGTSSMGVSASLRARASRTLIRSRFLEPLG